MIPKRLMIVYIGRAFAILWTSWDLEEVGRANQNIYGKYTISCKSGKYDV